MLAVLEKPWFRSRVPAFSVDQYHRLVESGLLPADVELICGALVEKMPKSPLHSSFVKVFGKYLELHLPSGWDVRLAQPLTLHDSEPEPDVAVVQGAWEDYLRCHPTTAALVAEISLSSENLDRLKAQLYAEAGVQEYWLIFPDRQMVERHTDPQDGAYRTITEAAFVDGLASEVFPTLKFPPEPLLRVES